LTRYRNARNEADTKELEEIEREDKVLQEPAKTVEEETWKKRYGDQRRYLDQVKNETKTKVDELERKLDLALRGQIKAPKSSEDVDAWMTQYPEFAGILETIVQSRIKEATSTTKEKLARIEEKSAELEKKEAILALKKLHPDLDKLTNSEDFHEWLKTQSKTSQDAIYGRLDVDDADFVISKYKNRKKLVDDDDTFSERDAARQVRKSAIVDEPDGDIGEYEFTESQIERESKKNRNWYSKNEDKIMSALQRGKVLFDVSGGAR
jgi:hypothetical protein